MFSSSRLAKSGVNQLMVRCRGNGNADKSLTGVLNGVTALEGNLALFIKTENPASRETLTHILEEVHGNTAYGEKLGTPKCPLAGKGTKCGIDVQWNIAQQKNDCIIAALVLG